MKLNSEDIRKLALDEIAGTLSETDREMLYSSIAEDADLYAVWRDVQDYFADTGTQHALASISEKLTIEGIKDKVVKKKKVNVIKLSRVATAASVLAMVISIIVIYWLPQKSSHSGNKQFADEISKSRIELTLSDGNIIDLSEEQDQVQIGGLTLTNKHNSLHYSPISHTSTLPAFASLYIPVGKDYKIVLSDGTEVWLNSTSSLRFPIQFSENSREVTVNGEAYFKVAEDARKPFIVHLPNCTVDVLGTEFNVNTYDSGCVNVALVTGSIRFNSKTDSTLLQPGKEITYRDKKELLVQPFDPDMLRWRQGIFVFHDAHLDKVLKVIPRWYGVSVVLDNPQLNEKRFFGIIDRSQPVQDLLERLKKINGIDYYIDENKIIHIR